MRSGFAAFIMLVSASMPTQALAGPFGLRQGTPLSGLQVVKNAESEYRYVIKVPTPLSEFDFYLATVTPKEGLCRVAAIGATLDRDPTGSSARGRYNMLKEALTEKYGSSKEYDFVHSGALFNKESDFAMAIQRKERTLRSYWGAEERSHLPPDISAIELSVEALSSSQTYVNVTYELGNFTACARSRIKAKSDAL